ncbi:UPF0146 family protein [Methanococcus maripaludis]|jgi:hypothetical protein|uniref:UPF0146 protein H0S71_07795 n=4 Tax=Methanococcus maripaludis TaxID=39152 RepID=A0A8T3W9A4_METMI|nr:UPF0146 family protein [Methanococcus maripaludis]AEK19618.1 hypothetical protein GYY_03695 [Methanococcus maripaludis X1]MBG0769780.1 UPF0146 family protein [Methanococcus maripaludis]BAP60721.1 hypothetical protein MMKA1_06040 [Methanococcus maripaludis KA1]BAP62685.1 hypothetical protein MMOS7_05990 [Methanococcus maripaludis OS7]
MDTVFKYIDENYQNLKNNGLKIAELGIGFYFNSAKKLKDSDFDVIVIDINKNAVLDAKDNGLNAFYDDLFEPNFEIYKNVGLIYSFRPPRDLQPFILKIAKKLNCDLIIKALSGEEPIEELKLVNYQGKPIYVWKRD